MYKDDYDTAVYMINDHDPLDFATSLARLFPRERRLHDLFCRVSALLLMARKRSGDDGDGVPLF